MKIELKYINKFCGILIGLLSIVLGIIAVLGIMHTAVEYSNDTKMIVVLLGWIIILKGLTISKVID